MSHNTASGVVCKPGDTPRELRSALRILGGEYPVLEAPASRIALSFEPNAEAGVCRVARRNPSRGFPPHQTLSIYRV